MSDQLIDFIELAEIITPRAEIIALPGGEMTVEYLGYPNLFRTILPGFYVRITDDKERKEALKAVRALQ